jgi:tetratricopeptide (TPR) repeat protein
MTVSDVSATTVRPMRRTADLRGVFVGRSAELALLRAALDDVCAGQTRIVLVAGEPGMGKTRIAQELAANAGARDVHVLWGRCWEGDGAPALWPWMQIIRAYLSAHDAGTVGATMGAGAIDIATIVPEVRVVLPHLPAAEPIDPDAARFRFFDSVTSFLRRASEAEPFVLILDDLHRADAASLRLLCFLARESGAARLLIVGTYRDTELTAGHRLSAALAELVAAGAPLRLESLNESEVAQLVEEVSGREPSPELARSVYERTEGHPLFVREFVQILAKDGQIDEVSAATVASLRIPPGARETIRYRLDQLSAKCQQALGVASAIGRDFDAELLRRSCATSETAAASPTDTLGVLDEAGAAGVVDLLPAAVARYRFSHVLIRDVLCEDVPVSERVEMHRAIGEALEDLHDGRPDEHLAALAQHFFAAIPVGTAAKAVAYAIKAAQRSARLFAHEDAVAQYQLALRALEAGAAGGGSHAAAPLQRIELLIALGEEQHRAGDPTAARTILAEAARCALELAASEHLARAAIAYVGLGEWSGGSDRTAIDLLRQALAALPQEAGVLRVRVLGRLATLLDYAGDREAANPFRQEALTLAERFGDSAALGEALSEVHVGMLASEDVAACLHIATRIVAIAEAGGLKSLALPGHFGCFRDLLQCGDIGGADHALRAFTAYAETLRQPFDLYRSRAMAVMRLLLAGRFNEAEVAANEAFAAGMRAQSPNAALIYAVQMWTLRRDQGRLDEIEPAVRGFVDAYAVVPATRAALALLYAELEREADARVEFEQLAAHDFTDVPRDVNWVNFLDMTAQVCAFLGDTRHAATL